MPPGMTAGGARLLEEVMSDGEREARSCRGLLPFAE